MRPIDADRLLKMMSHWKPYMDMDNVRDAINKMPTLTPPNEWVSVEERLPEPGSLIAYTNKYGNVAMYGILRVPKNDRPNRYDYWAYLQELPDRRPPEGEA